MFSRHSAKVAVLALAVTLIGSTVSPALGPATAIAAAASPCASLTPLAIQQVIDKINVAVASQTDDERANGTTGAYASAARDSLAYVTGARDSMVGVQTWLRTNGLESPYVTNTTAAYNVHGTVRETVVKLLYAQHWAMISAVYHRSNAARTTYEATASASEIALQLGADAGRCYMLAWFP